MNSYALNRAQARRYAAPKSSSDSYFSRRTQHGQREQRWRWKALRLPWERAVRAVKPEAAGEARGAGTPTSLAQASAGCTFTAPKEQCSRERHSLAETEGPVSESSSEQFQQVRPNDGLTTTTICQKGSCCLHLRCYTRITCSSTAAKDI